MNLEYLEEQCVKYLAQTTNPLVPLKSLLQYLQRDTQCADITRNELLAFLQKHELVHIVETMPEADPEMAEHLEEIGLQSGPRVILRTRIPTPAELTGLIERQIVSMTEALQKALDEAEERGNHKTAGKAREVLDRLEILREAFKKVL